MDILAATEGYQFTLHRASGARSRHLVVTFGGQPSGLGESGFGTRFCAQQGWDTLHVAQRAGSQYQDLSVETFAQVVAPVARDWDDVICYGSSLGAYAALYYGGSINARILAAAPMLPAWRPLKNRAYADVPINHVEMKDVPRSEHSPAVIYDPELARDKFVVTDMVKRAYPDAREIHVPFGGHTVLITLSHARLLKPLVSTFVEEDKIIDFTPPAEGNAMYHGERACHLKRTAPEEALKECETSLSLRPMKRVFNTYIEILLKLGWLDLAQTKINEAKRSGDKQLQLIPFRERQAAEMGLMV